MTVRQHTVLLVEDNYDNRAIYTAFLNHRGYRVIEATDGGAGISMTQAEHPDIVLMDVSLPTTDGWTATRTLKSDPATAMIPIIALTAHALTGDRQRSIEAGCDGYLAKPIEPMHVVAEIERILGLTSGTEPAKPLGG